MKYRTWTLVAGGFLCLIATLVGCGQKPEPASTEAGAKTETAPSANSNVAIETKTESIKLVHELDPAKQVLPGGMVAGSVGGASFKPEAMVEIDNLIFRAIKPGTQEIEREFRLKLGSSDSLQPFENRKLTIRQDMPEGREVPEILVSDPKGNLHLFPNGYALTLELGARLDGKVAGKIYLCLPDDEKTVLAGVFVAAYPRQPTEVPGPEDVPFIRGLVNVIGAPPNAVLRVGYIANPNPDLLALGVVDTQLGEPITPLRWARNDNDKPRVTTLIAGDGKNVPSRYEHSKLTQGRYLVFAALEPNGPAAWQWVSVLPRGTHIVDLTIDATHTGGVDISAPFEAVKSVQMVPADNADQPPLDATMFTACTWQLGLERPIIAQKVLYKNLAPGRYEVRAGGKSRIVEIQAGKTIELEFDKNFTIPPKAEPAPAPKPKE
jgi:hypothetical protein